MGGGGHKGPTLKLRALNCYLTLKLCVCFQKYILTSQEKKHWSKSQKVSDILRFENFLDLRFCHDLTHENGRDSLNFSERGLIFWIFSYLYVLKKSYLKT